jgi:KDO2-lipid IV(A) lauroyltransferase
MKKRRTTRIILIVFGSIPLGARRALFRGISLLIYHISLKHRMITLNNLMRSFPEKNLSEIKRIAKGSFRNLGVMAAEFFEAFGFTRDNITDWVDFEGRDIYERALARRKGILFYSAHFGNWELGAAAFALGYQPIYAIYRLLDNPILEDLLLMERSITGNKLLTKGGVVRKIIKILKENKVVGIMMDQNMSWREGVFVDFFGRPACTTRRFAEIALQTGSPVLPVFIFRQDDGRYKIVVKEAEIIRTGDYDRDILLNTQNFTTIVEEVVREHPDQWFWLHQRWKTKKCQVGKPRATGKKEHVYKLAQRDKVTKAQSNRGTK